MTTKSNAENSTSRGRRQSIWARLSPFLDVIGAVLIFGSWISSNTLTRQAEDRAKAHEAMIQRVRQFRLYDDFAIRISGIQSDLVRTRNLVEFAAQSRDASVGSASSVPEVAVWTGMTHIQMGELASLVESLDLYAGQLSVSQDVRHTLDAAQTGVGKLSTTFESAHDAYDRLVQEQDASNSLADKDSSLSEKGEALRKHVGGLWKSYDEAKQSMLHAGNSLLRTADAESKSASRLAKRCERVSWVLYVVGTLIILFGRAKGVLAKTKTSVS